MTVEIKSITAANGGAQVRLSLEMRDGEHVQRQALTLLTCQYAAIRPQKGEISQQTYERIARQAQICEAVMRGMGMLGYGACSEKGLARKLQSRGYESGVAKAAAAYLVRNGYICEESDAEREAERCVKKLWGRNRIASFLLEKGYAQEAVSAAIDGIPDSVLQENCVAAARKRFASMPQTPAEKKKAYDALSRLGFSSAQIRTALSRLAEEEE